MILKCEKGNGSIKVLQDVLQGTEDNRLFPFLWMHGEDEETLRDELRHIRACGISSVCLESRPHPDFVGARWWKDVDVIMDEPAERACTYGCLTIGHSPPVVPTAWRKKRRMLAPSLCAGKTYRRVRSPIGCFNPAARR